MSYLNRQEPNEKASPKVYPLLAKYGVRVVLDDEGNPMGTVMEDFFQAMKDLGIYNTWVARGDQYTSAGFGLYPWDAEDALAGRAHAD